MRWQADRRRKSGGYWRCRIKAREYSRNYYKSERGQETNRRGATRYFEKKKAEGLCVYGGCKEPATSGVHCSFHKKDASDRVHSYTLFGTSRR